jgi:hypothetical protein
VCAQTTPSTQLCWQLCPFLKRQVLQSESLVGSGVVPESFAIEKYSVTRVSVRALPKRQRYLWAVSCARRVRAALENQTRGIAMLFAARTPLGSQALKNRMISKPVAMRYYPSFSHLRMGLHITK